MMNVKIWHDCTMGWVAKKDLWKVTFKLRAKWQRPKGEKIWVKSLQKQETASEKALS